MYKQYTVYRIYKLNEHGMLQEPRNRYGTPVFSTWGYDTREEAREAIEAQFHDVNAHEFLVLPVAVMNWEPE